MIENVEAIYLFPKSKTRRDGSINITHVVVVENWEQEFKLRDNDLQGDASMGQTLRVDFELQPAQIQREYEGRSYLSEGIELRPVAARVEVAKANGAGKPEAAGAARS